MGVRRQIYLEESDDRLLEQRSRATGLSVSELIRQAIHQCHGAGHRLSWDEVFAPTIRVGSAGGETWAPDQLLDAEYADLDGEPKAEGRG